MFNTLAFRSTSALFLTALTFGACDSTGTKVHFDGSTDLRSDAGSADASADLTADLAADLTAAAPDTGAAMPEAAAPLTPDAAPTPPACSFSRFPLRRLPAEMVLVLDRSASMRTPIAGTNGTRWSEITAAANEVVASTNGKVAWGLKYFPSTEGCAVSAGLDVSVGNDLVGSMRATQPNAGVSGSPLPEAVRRAAGALSSRQTPAPRFLVLATDGEPSCPAGAEGVASSVDAVTQAAKAGIRTFVLGVTAPDAEDQATLNQLATAGGEPNADAVRYYTAGTKTKFLAALTSITSRVTSCVFHLDTPPGAAEGNAVYFDGRKIPMDPMQREGWNWGATRSQVNIYGAACEALKTATTPPSGEIVHGCTGAPAP